MRKLQQIQSQSDFNPRPRKEGDSSWTSGTALGRHFNPRPRKEGDAIAIFPLPSAYIISIHALVKRATCYPTIRADARTISIHALVKRATLCKFCKTIGAVYFNPRPRKEGDRTTGVLLLLYRISIHALVKRATPLYSFSSLN